MTKCNFEWSVCTTCANAGFNLCPLENNRTIKKLKREIEELKQKLDDLEYKNRSSRYSY